MHVLKGETIRDSSVLPGTTIPSSGAENNAFGTLRNMIAVTGGLSLSQVCTVTGLEASTIQNWVKRGWIGGSLKDKKYNAKQVARIIIINALRGSLLLDDIAALLKYVNGIAGDLSDDIIDEGELYDLMCLCVFMVAQNLNNVSNSVEKALKSYKGTPDNLDRLRNALYVMTYACVSTEVRSKANLKLREFI